jgi:hypothetical protein
MVIPPFRLKQHDKAQGTFGLESHSRAANLVGEGDRLGRRAVSAKQDIILNVVLLPHTALRLTFHIISENAGLARDASLCRST